MMALRIIVGRAGSGKSAHCIREIRDRQQQQPMGAPLIYLVPQQMSFQVEYELAAQAGVSGTMRAQVFSFRRLAWKILQEVGGLSRIHIDSTGMKMILRRILEKRGGELRVFGRAMDRNGFTDQLEEMYGELVRHGMTAEDLLVQQEALIRRNEGEGNGFLADKLHDMHLIYDELERYLADRYLDTEHYLPLLAERLERSRYICGAEIWVDGFEHFTPQELLVLKGLWTCAGDMTVTLTLEAPSDPGTVPDELDLFYSSAITYRVLTELAEKSGIRVESPIVLSQTGPVARFARNPELAHLEAYYNQHPVRPYPYSANSIRMIAAANRRAEIEGAAQRILSLVRDKGYRWRDIVVLVRNSKDYEHLFTTVFEDYDIPIFLDEKRPMLHHPLTELIRSALEVIRYNWRYEAIFRCIKTELLFQPEIEETAEMMRHRIDRIENYVLAHGIEGYRWTDPNWEWKYRIYRGLDENSVEVAATMRQSDEELAMEEEITQLRKRITAPLQQLERALTKAKNVRELCEGLYLFLMELNVPLHLEQWSEAAKKEHRLEQAREHGQVWQALINMLDQIVEVMGDERMDMETFASVIEAGMENLKFALVPPALDQVLVGSLDRTRFANVKCAFILGINDGVIPARPKDDGMLSEGERETLLASGMLLGPGSRRKLMEEEFMLYRALTSASEYLFLSYALADEEGKGLLPSALMKRMKEMFPQVKEEFVTTEVAEVAAEEDQLAFLANPSRALSYLSAQLQQWRKGYGLAPLWWDAYNWLLREMPERQACVTQALFYRNEERALQKETSQALYGKKIRASVSRMERFQACPFSHFASYGLKLRERELYRLEAPDIGQLFHAALKLVGEHMEKKQVEWGALEAEQMHRLAAEQVDVLSPLLQKQILLSSGRNRYITHKLKNVVGRAAVMLGEHARRSKFTPRALELGFGMGAQLPPLVFDLNGCTMELVGRIDRVDGAESTQGLLLRIIDYKSSAKDLVIEDVYFGLSLQMLTYLDVLISQAEAFFGETAVPAGILYFHVHNPLLRSLVPLSEDKIQDEIRKRFKMKGLLVENEEIVRLMDTELETGYSDILPVALKKDGGFYSTSRVISSERLDQLRRYTRAMIREVGQRITDGDISIYPYRHKKRIACTFCTFKSVCQFDQMVEPGEFHVLRRESDEVMWQEIVEKGENV
ncbi:helicase-exonuclease AddAB subunit AddB [Aneurinibacillus aneurinilyticus]|uniref:ATP-dependent helicase/deoxyribonuclease subunit B n=1 Tax=Aneurinibacillus aneurinilyticus ATCC 12856 TaxID=649747 RepID=U1Y5B9_ANEAE|nr:helicase-exonuclease AddAB subunit AddB [Aneurinibacillus aneurinilyticus]ERI07342.1 ATP-dependent nuclease subunit B [Aneurinibacillus aneurinilyticus ATCC 12856]MED0709389.1 helicase-exonuclease AddAB subunit AddB [Aneurinibacillus aneurinilyticus]MED0725993.1 helicase-exonuclease AddAB subunit AddB [Aneurinibacillus aneurinilyticus]MED0733899.1 helicase-exonuclease AddAB subunit AddB [Aneurinibacillus aneurinilyticus]MED0743957.1 helicase-exonuclease AddAB subunit AddB [Aneurinibacillus 